MPPEVYRAPVIMMSFAPALNLPNVMLNYPRQADAQELASNAAGGGGGEITDASDDGGMGGADSGDAGAGADGGDGGSGGDGGGE